MHDWKLPLALAMALGLGLGYATAAQADEQTGPACVQYQKNAPYRGFGYLHQVTVQNRCEGPVTCSVATDVDREHPQTVNLDANADQTVTLRRGSPARAFEVILACHDAR